MSEIGAKDFDEYMNDHFAEETVVEIGGVDITIRHHLTISDTIDFVEYVVKNCIQGDDYYPEIKDFLIRTQIVSKYTNIELPDDAEDRYAFLYRSDIVSEIVKNINTNELNNMIRAIDCKLDNVREVAFAEYKKKMDIIYKSLMSMVERAESIYKDMTPEEIENLMKAVIVGEDGAVDQKALVQAMSDLRKEVDGR